MNLFKELISSIEPNASNTSPAPSPIQRLPSGSPKPTQRPAGSANGTPEASGLKRKASGPVDGAQVKIQRKEGSTLASQTNDAARIAPKQGSVKTNTGAPATSVPYRGTAGLSASKAAGAPAKKPIPSASTQTATSKAAAPVPKPAPKPAPAASSTAAVASTKKPGGYMAMLMKAKEKDSTKPIAPPIKNEPTKIMTKKDREKARLEAKAAAKGKKPGAGVPTKSTDGKVDAGKEKRKPADVGYQGTARPAKKPADLGYKGTAKPSAAAPTGKAAAAAAAKSKPKPNQGRYGGYASWSDEELEGEEEDDYASDASSDMMEGGMFDLEEEEAAALKAARQEDAQALAEEMELKRQKEERKRKLMAMSKAAANKRKY